MGLAFNKKDSMMRNLLRRSGVIAALVLVGLAGGALAGCHKDPVEVCNKGCDVVARCASQSAEETAACKRNCKTAGDNSKRCSNYNEVVDCAGDCVDKTDCAEVAKCESACPPCKT